MTTKLTVTANRNMFGRKSGGYSALLGPFEERAETHEAAIAALENTIQQTGSYAYHRVYRVTPSGIVFVLYNTLGQWAYDIVRAGQNGKCTSSTCMLGKRTLSAALLSMEGHWQDMCADEQAVAAAVA